ncbi:hypothetical protein GGR53DRAFT_472066 [Hypoxylon sp. FL1150]|nr:hypothetical protein GGR53DRAFT_472066 [Hypoxylon sp. FL1150]
MTEILDSDSFDLLSSPPRSFAATPTVSDPSTVSDTESMPADSLIISSPRDRGQPGQDGRYSFLSSSNPASETASVITSQLPGSDDQSDWDMDVDGSDLADHHHYHNDFFRESSEESLFVGEDFDRSNNMERGEQGGDRRRHTINYQLAPLSSVPDMDIDEPFDFDGLPPMSDIVDIDYTQNQIDELVGMEVEGSRNARDRQRPQRRQHRTQPEVIDLTGDASSPQAAPQRGSQNARRRHSQRNSPPRLSRSDASYVGERTVIDLVSDSDDEPQAIGMPPLRGNNRPRPPRRVPSIIPLQDLPELEQAAQRRAISGGFPRQFQRYLGGLGNLDHVPLFDWLNNRNRAPGDDVVMLSHRQLLPADNPARPDGGLPQFPVRLNYDIHPFQNHPPPPAVGGGTPKPLHEPPKETRPGFTRNTAEDVIAICPSCEKELAYEDGDGAICTPAKKGRSKKDKAEHHFWAVKACGHVYCRKCFEHRKPTGKNPPPVGFRPDPSGAKNKMLCAVEDCESEVSSKSVWVGIFM